jgi:nucleoside-diphosphate kinase
MLDLVQENMAMTAVQMFTLSPTEAGEFLEVYKGVVPPGEFSSMVDEMTAGPCIAVEVSDLCSCIVKGVGQGTCPRQHLLGCW